MAQSFFSALTTSLFAFALVHFFSVFTAALSSFEARTEAVTVAVVNKVAAAMSRYFFMAKIVTLSYDILIRLPFSKDSYPAFYFLVDLYIHLRIQRQ